LVNVTNYLSLCRRNSVRLYLQTSSSSRNGSRTNETVTRFMIFVSVSYWEMGPYFHRLYTSVSL